MRDTLSWIGDNIGMTGGERPARVSLQCGTGGRIDVSFRDVLAFVDCLDKGGIARLEQAMQFVAAVGKLHPDDLAAWKAAAPSIAGLTAARADAEVCHG
jgi:predicted Rdx family selenoprotein